MKKYFTYLLLCRDGTYYTGWTTDLEQRLKAHNSGKGAKYTRARLPVKMMYFEESPSRSEAQKKEYSIRHLPASAKADLAGV